MVTLLTSHRSSTVMALLATPVPWSMTDVSSLEIGIGERRLTLDGGKPKVIGARGANAQGSLYSVSS